MSERLALSKHISSTAVHGTDASERCPIKLPVSAGGNYTVSPMPHRLCTAGNVEVNPSCLSVPSDEQISLKISDSIASTECCKRAPSTSRDQLTQALVEGDIDLLVLPNEDHQDDGGSVQPFVDGCDVMHASGLSHKNVMCHPSLQSQWYRDVSSSRSISIRDPSVVVHSDGDCVPQQKTLSPATVSVSMKNICVPDAHARLPEGGEVYTQLDFRCLMGKLCDIASSDSTNSLICEGNKGAEAQVVSSRQTVGRLCQDPHYGSLSCIGAALQDVNGLTYSVNGCDDNLQLKSLHVEAVEPLIPTDTSNVALVSLEVAATQPNLRIHPDATDAETVVEQLDEEKSALVQRVMKLSEKLEKLERPQRSSGVHTGPRQSEGEAMCRKLEATERVLEKVRMRAQEEQQNALREAKELQSHIGVLEEQVAHFMKLQSTWAQEKQQLAAAYAREMDNLRLQLCSRITELEEERTRLSATLEQEHKQLEVLECRNASLEMSIAASTISHETLLKEYTSKLESLHQRGDTLRLEREVHDAECADLLLEKECALRRATESLLALQGAVSKSDAKVKYLENALLRAEERTQAAEDEQRDALCAWQQERSEWGVARANYDEQHSHLTQALDALREEAMQLRELNNLLAAQLALSEEQDRQGVDRPVQERRQRNKLLELGDGTNVTVSRGERDVCNVLDISKHKTVFSRHNNALGATLMRGRASQEPTGERESLIKGSLALMERRIMECGLYHVGDVTSQFLCDEGSFLCVSGGHERNQSSDMRSDLVDFSNRLHPKSSTWWHKQLYALADCLDRSVVVLHTAHKAGILARDYARHDSLGQAMTDDVRANPSAGSRMLEGTRECLSHLSTAAGLLRKTLQEGSVPRDLVMRFAHGAAARFQAALLQLLSVSHKLGYLEGCGRLVEEEVAVTSSMVAFDVALSSVVDTITRIRRTSKWLVLHLPTLLRRLREGTLMHELAQPLSPNTVGSFERTLNTSVVSDPKDDFDDRNALFTDTDTLTQRDHRQSSQPHSAFDSFMLDSCNLSTARSPVDFHPSPVPPRRSEPYGVVSTNHPPTPSKCAISPIRDCLFPASKFSGTGQHQLLVESANNTPHVPCVNDCSTHMLPWRTARGMSGLRPAHFLFSHSAEGLRVSRKRRRVQRVMLPFHGIDTESLTALASRNPAVCNWSSAAEGGENGMFSFSVRVGLHCGDVLIGLAERRIPLVCVRGNRNSITFKACYYLHLGRGTLYCASQGLRDSPYPSFNSCISGSSEDGIKVGEVITCVLHLQDRAIRFFRNGFDCGVAFADVPVSIPLCPAIEMNALGSLLDLL